MNNKLKLILGVAGLFFVLSFSGFDIVDTGHRGVKTKFGEVVSDSLTEGIYFYNPFVYSIVELDARTFRVDSETQTYTKDIQQADVQYGLNVQLDPMTVHEVYRDVGKDWLSAIVEPAVVGSVKAVMGNWDAVDLIANRQKATLEVTEQIRKQLDNKGIKLHVFEFLDIAYQDEFEKAVEAKVTAIQRASEAKNKTIQIEEEAKQKVISAKAEAESIRIRTEALSKSPALIEYEAVQKWDGVLPTYMLGETTPMINLGK